MVKDRQLFHALVLAHIKTLIRKDISRRIGRVLLAETVTLEVTKEEAHPGGGYAGVLALSLYRMEDFRVTDGF